MRSLWKQEASEGSSGIVFKEESVASSGGTTMRRAASQVLAHSLWFGCRPYSAYSYSSFPSRIGYYCGILSISSCPFVSGQGSSLLKVSADCRARVAEELGIQRKDNYGCKRVRASAVACMSGIAMDSNVHKISPEDVLHFW